MSISNLLKIKEASINVSKQDEAPSSDWMAHLPEEIANVPLSQIAIPGKLVF